MCGKAWAARITTAIILLLAVLITASVSGCTGLTTSSPTPASNITYTILDYSLDPPLYTTTHPVVDYRHKGNFSLYGRITVNGAPPPGFVSHLKPSEYNVSESDEAVDTIGAVEVSSVAMYISTSGTVTDSDANWVPFRGFIDPSGNYRIDGLHPGEMSFYSLEFNTPPGEPYEDYSIHGKGYGLIRLNLTKYISRCDLDLTNVTYLGRSSDGVDMYDCHADLKNVDL